MHFFTACFVSVAITSQLFFLSQPLESQAAAQTTKPINNIVAVVNGEMITRFDFENATKAELLKANIDPTNIAQQAAAVQLQNIVLEKMINSIIVEQEAERRKVTINESDVTTGMQRFQEEHNLTDSEFLQYLNKEGFTLETFRDQLRTQLLQQELLRTMVGRQVVVTQEEIEQFYQDNPEMFASGSMINVALLVYPTAAEAEKWAADLIQNPALFTKTVQELSIGPNAENGGELGSMALSDLASALRNQAMQMPIGDVSQIFDLEGMPAQIKLLANAPDAEAMALEEVRPQIENHLRAPKLQTRYEEYMTQLRKRAVVDIRQ